MTFVLAQAADILDVGSQISGWGALGWLAVMFATDRLKTRKDLERVEQQLAEAELLRNEALTRERETLERVIPLVVASNDLVARMAAKHLGPDSGQ